MNHLLCQPDFFIRAKRAVGIAERYVLHFFRHVVRSLRCQHQPYGIEFPSHQGNGFGHALPQLLQGLTTRHFLFQHGKGIIPAACHVCFREIVLHVLPVAHNREALNLLGQIVRCAHQFGSCFRQRNIVVRRLFHRLKAPERANSGKQKRHSNDHRNDHHQYGRGLQGDSLFLLFLQPMHRLMPPVRFLIPVFDRPAPFPGQEKSAVYSNNCNLNSRLYQSWKELASLRLFHGKLLQRINSTHFSLTPFPFHFKKPPPISF